VTTAHLILTALIIATATVLFVTKDWWRQACDGEILSLEEFGDDLALTTIYQPDCSNADRPQLFDCFVIC
jgi:hypothetical protein